MSENEGVGSGPALWRRARGLMPGGGQLLSKRAERFLPDLWPAYYSTAKGCEVWDLDGKRYFDFAQMGVGCCVLGYGDEDVDRAVRSAVDAGVMATLNCPEEVEFAELLLEVHPWAEMVRYARTGGEACAIAVRAARAATGRSTVVFCGYHGWHDWYLAANLHDPSALDQQLLPGLEPLGVAESLRGTAHAFRYNDAEQLEAILTNQREGVAAIVMEPRRSTPPAPGFLDRVRALADQSGAVLVFDEVTTGFRTRAGGIHLGLGVLPDIAILGKSLGNGYAISAVVGTRDALEPLGRSFVSSTFWTERIGLAAGLATVRKFVEREVGDHLVASGERVSNAWCAAAENAGLGVSITGIPPLTTLAFQLEEPLVAQTLYAQSMLDRGFLAGAAVYTTLAYDDEILDTFSQACGEAFREVADAYASGEPRSRLRGRVIQPGFGRLN